MGSSSQSAGTLSRLDNILPADSKIIWDCIYAGLSVKQTARKLDYTFPELEAWFYDPQRQGLLNRARASLASQLAHETLLIADANHPVPDPLIERDPVTGAPSGIFPTPPDAARDKLRIQARQWLASKWNKDLYAATPQVQVNIDAKSLHIDSLRKSSNDLQATGRLNAVACIPPVQLVDNTASLNAMPAAVDPPASPYTPPSGDGGTSSRGKGLEGNGGTTGIEYRPEDRAD